MNQTQKNDTAKERRLQVVLPLDLDLKLPEDESLSLLIEIMEEMDTGNCNVALCFCIERQQAHCKNPESKTKYNFSRADVFIKMRKLNLSLRCFCYLSYYSIQ